MRRREIKQASDISASIGGLDLSREIICTAGDILKKDIII